MLTLLLIVLPILSGLIVFAAPKAGSRQIAMISSLLSLALGIVVYTQLDPAGGTQFAIDVPWIDMLGMRFHIGIDGISMLMI